MARSVAVPRLVCSVLLCFCLHFFLLVKLKFSLVEVLLDPGCGKQRVWRPSDRKHWSK